MANWCLSREETELPEEIRYPTKLNSCCSKKSVFGFSRGLRNCKLLLGTPRDGIATKIDNEGVGGGKIILLSSPVRVQVGM